MADREGIGGIGEAFSAFTSYWSCPVMTGQLQSPGYPASNHGGSRPKAQKGRRPLFDILEHVVSGFLVLAEVQAHDLVLVANSEADGLVDELQEDIRNGK
jgi:hypothetical protein